MNQAHRLVVGSGPITKGTSNLAGIPLVCCGSIRYLFEMRLSSLRFATEEALEEIHRTLVPGGSLGLIWNVEDCGVETSAL